MGDRIRSSRNSATSDRGTQFLRDALKKVVVGIAGIFSFSLIGIIGLPLTWWWGVIASVLLLVVVGVLCLRKASLLTAIVTLTLAAFALMAINFASLLRSSDTLYVFECASLTPDCVLTHPFTTFGKRVHAIPVLKLKLPLYRLVLQGRTSSYFPRQTKYNSGYLIYSPLEKDAAQIFSEHVRSPSFTMVFQPKAQVQIADVTLNADKTLDLSEMIRSGMSFDLVSTLSNNSPGLFSTITAGDPDVGDWNRAIFANELVRALYDKEPTQLLDELERQSRSTGKADDFIRFATLSVIFDEAYYSGTTGIGQRTYDIRQFIHNFNRTGGLTILREHPWNSAFIHATLDACFKMERGIKDLDQSGAPPERLQTDDANKLDPPFAPELKWATNRTADELAIDAQIYDDLLLKHISEEMKGVSASEAASKLFNFVMSSMNQSFGDDRAADLVISMDKARYPEEAATWIRKSTDSSRDHRIQDLAGAIDRRAFSLYMGLYQMLATNASGLPAETEQINGKRAELDSLSEKLQFLDTVVSNALQKHLIGVESEKIKMVHSAFDAVSGIVQKCKNSSVSRTNCFESNLAPFLSDFVVSPIFQFFFSSGTAKQEAISQILETALEANTDPRSLGEFDQVLASMLTATQRHSPNSIPPSAFAGICSSADRFSSNLLVRPDFKDRIILHNAAVVLAYACSRSWGDQHRRVLFDARLAPDRWVDALIARMSQGSAKSDR
jgi:hypothetical protein